MAGFSLDELEAQITPGFPQCWTALEALVVLKDAKAQTAISRHLSNRDGYIRRKVVVELGKHSHGREWLPQLRELLHDGNPLVAAAAVESITALGDRESIPALLILLKSRETWRSIIRSIRE